MQPNAAGGPCSAAHFNVSGSFAFTFPGRTCYSLLVRGSYCNDCTQNKRTFLWPTQGNACLFLAVKCNSNLQSHGLLFSLWPYRLKRMYLPVHVFFYLLLACFHTDFNLLLALFCKYCLLSLLLLWNAPRPIFFVLEWTFSSLTQERIC